MQWYTILSDHHASPKTAQCIQAYNSISEMWSVDCSCIFSLKTGVTTSPDILQKTLGSKMVYQLHISAEALPGAEVGL